MLTNFEFIRQPEAISERSFEIIRTKLEGSGYTPPGDEAAWLVIQRVVHSTADFDFAFKLKFHPLATAAIIQALKAGSPIITDVKMLQAGLKHRLLKILGVEVYCYIDHPEAIKLARTENITVSMAAMRLAVKIHAEQNPIFAIGNAPTALFELLEMVKASQVQPSAIVGIPVGFVSVAESKVALMQLETTPWITATGCKGGSAATAAALNALILRSGDG